MIADAVYSNTSNQSINQSINQKSEIKQVVLIAAVRSFPFTKKAKCVGLNNVRKFSMCRVVVLFVLCERRIDNGSVCFDAPYMC